ncbi:glycosyltransferase family 2 protein [Larkinella punicea]|uniref:Glycosyltransferase n=1 Tax=Larkinella punicea TaxID=2315727 RepID=A0A368JM44_9BACT|nr:glycosyltransferase family 2 protein [Larkinella punicea]RCR67623.1 glycosyltransferase [Larkinella punicea]
MYDFTVITINKNNRYGLEKTILSVLSQEYIKIEYILVDGDSTDGSYDIIEKYKDRISFLFCEKDQGIYDAMNKGLSKANGIWTIFLNSGDLFYNADVLYKVLQNRSIYNKDVLYGSVVFNTDGFFKINKPTSLSAFYYKLPFCHQSSLIKTTVLKKYSFNTAYRIASDYDLYSRIYLDNGKFYNLGFPISIFSDGGISSTENQLLYREYAEISLLLYNRFLKKRLSILYYTHQLMDKFIAYFIKLIILISITL